MNNALDVWIDKLNAGNLPAFARTVREVSSVALDRASSAKDLSAVVSRDAAMTARLIQLINSSLFNIQGNRIETVSSAVVMLGFDSVRDLAVSLSVLDEMLKGDQHQQVGQMMARAFQAAAHAKSLSSGGKQRRSEEVFVAALLKEVGQMAFWSKAGEEAERLRAAMRAGEDSAAAEKRILGFALDALSQRLAKEWNLGETAYNSHDAAFEADDKVASVRSGHTLARLLERHEWGSAEVEAELARVAKRFDLDADTFAGQVFDNLEQARAMAEQFGVQMEVQAEPQPELQPEPQPTVAAPVCQQPVLDTDQADILLAQLSQGIEDEVSRDELMHLLVEGSGDCLDAQACYFLLLTPDRQQFVPKYTWLADGTGLPGQRSATGQDILSQALADRKVRQCQVPVERPWHGGGTACINGVHIAGKAVGVFYCEWPAGADLDTVLAGKFRQFAQQIALVLTQAN